MLSLKYSKEGWSQYKGWVGGKVIIFNRWEWTIKVVGVFSGTVKKIDAWNLLSQVGNFKWTTVNKQLSTANSVFKATASTYFSFGEGIGKVP